MSGAEANNDDGPKQRYALLAKQDKLPEHHKFTLLINQIWSGVDPSSSLILL
jgi:hypothetical protein